MATVNRTSVIRERTIEAFAQRQKAQNPSLNPHQEGTTNMAQPNKNTPTQNTQTAKTATPAPAQNTAAKPDAKPLKGERDGEREKAKAKRQKVRYVSTKDDTYWVRARVDVIGTKGAPVDPWGVPMIAKAAQPFGQKLSPEEKAKREADKAAVKKAEADRVAGMSDTERVAYETAKRDERKAKQQNKANAKADAMKAQIIADIKSGKLVI